MLVDFSTAQLVGLFVVAFAAGILNAISGGGGMILIPSMLAFGVPPINAITINKFQNALGAVAAIKHYMSRNLVEFKQINRNLIFVLLSAIAGALCLDHAANSGI